MKRQRIPQLLIAVVMLMAVGSIVTPAPVATQTTGSTSALEDPFVQERAKVGLDHLYDLRFHEAQMVFQEIDRRYPNHPIGPFLGALNTWWEILIDLSDTSHDKAFYAAMDEVIRRSDAMLKRDKTNFDAYFFKGAALGFRGRLRSNRGDWFKAAMDGKRAMDYVLAVARKDPNNADYIFGKGIYDYYAAVVAEKYPFTKPVMVFFPSGDRERGIAELTRTATQGTLIQTEAASCFRSTTCSSRITRRAFTTRTGCATGTRRTRSFTRIRGASSPAGASGIGQNRFSGRY